MHYENMLHSVGKYYSSYISIRNPGTDDHNCITTRIPLRSMNACNYCKSYTHMKCMALQFLYLIDRSLSKSRSFMLLNGPGLGT
ncbi:hypothetical protein Mapa_000605 [Marchantia paleacea]|nr:hypothetical protein Mapa_000605 [Marchantia paleacea]